MKVVEIQLPLPSTPKREAPTMPIAPEREHHAPRVADPSKLSDADRATSSWVYCLGRGNHDFDDEGVCVDCAAKRIA